MDYGDMTFTGIPAGIVRPREWHVLVRRKCDRWATCHTNIEKGTVTSYMQGHLVKRGLWTSKQYFPTSAVSIFLDS